MKKKFLFFSLVWLLIFTSCKERVASPSTSTESSAEPAPHPGVPDDAMQTLDYISTHHEAPEGYVGGRNFQNRERQLPRTDDKGNRIRYQEWDVHEKIKGENRGAERLVTGSDGSAYYTDDHYRNFKKIR